MVGLRFTEVPVTDKHQRSAQAASYSQGEGGSSRAKPPSRLHNVVLAVKSSGMRLSSRPSQSMLGLRLDIVVPSCMRRSTPGAVITRHR